MGPFFGWEIRSVNGRRGGRRVRQLESPWSWKGLEGDLSAYFHDLLDYNTLLTGVKRKMQIFLPAKHAESDKRGVELA